MYATGWVVANTGPRPPLDPGFKLERRCVIEPKD
jgi:hypothetical protein